MPLMILVYNMKLVQLKVLKVHVKEDLMNFNAQPEIPVEHVLLSKLMEENVQKSLNSLMLLLLNMDLFMELIE